MLLRLRLSMNNSLGSIQNLLHIDTLVVAGGRLSELLLKWPPRGRPVIFWTTF